MSEAKRPDDLLKLALEMRRGTACLGSISRRNNARRELIEDLAAALESDRALLKQAEAERDEARDWVRRMHNEQSVLTCVYCGHAYPPGTPPSNAEALTVHVAVCPKHPMAVDRALLRRILEGWSTNDHGKALTIAIAEARARIGEGK